MLFGLINCRRRALEHVPVRQSTLSHARLRVACLLVLFGLGAGLAEAKRITATAETKTSTPTILFLPAIPITSIWFSRVLRTILRLFLNSHLQFSSRDEYRIHEALVHPGLAAVRPRARPDSWRRAMALHVREILKYPQVESITSSI